MSAVQMLPVLRHKLRALVDLHPSLYLPLCRLRPGARTSVVTPDTDLVIEGFPRSANTFAVTAFTLSQKYPVRVAHHLHAPAHVIAAVRMGIPTLVLIRRPRDAVRSLLVKEPWRSAEQALADYVRFYRSISAHSEGYVLASFDEVTSDFGSVVRRLNERFGTHFTPFEHNECNVAACFRAIERAHAERTGRTHVHERSIGRPSDIRQRIMEGTSDDLGTPRHVVRLIARAEELYARVLGDLEQGM